MVSDVVIELKDVWKIYEMGATKTYALCGINLKIHKNEFVSIIGPSGSGKSTLMHIIGCLDTPTKGSVFIEKRDVSKLNENELAQIRRKKIGFVFQFFNLIPTLTALENVALPMRFDGVGKKDAESKAKTFLEKVGLSHRINHKPSELSGGEQQRVAIARALINDPELVLADEPTGNLDTKSGEEVLKILKDLHMKMKKTVVIVTHDPNVAKESKRKIYIKDGKIVKDE